MSMNVDDLVVRAALRDELSRPVQGIRQEIRGLRQDLDRVSTSGDRASSSTNRLGRTFDRVKSYGAGARRVIAGVATVMTTAASGAVVLGVKTASMLEQTQLAFETMLGSGRRAKKFIKDLKTFAANTPFDFPGISDAAKRLLAMGFEARDVLPTMTAVGDAVAGLGGGTDVLNGVVTALGQIRAKGKVSAEEMNQLAERGIPGWEYLAKAIGVSIPEAMKMAEKGAIKSGPALKALTDGMNRDFGGLMEKQSKTLGGRWSSLKDNALMALADMVKPLLPILTTVVEKLDHAVPVVARFFRQLRKGKGDAKPLHDLLVKVGNVIGVVIGWLVDHKEAVLGFAIAIGAITGAMAALSLVLNLNPVSLLIIAIAALVGWLVHLYRTNDVAREKMDKIWDAVKRFAAVVWSDLKPALDDARVAGIWLYENVLKPVGAWLADQMPWMIDAAAEAFKYWVWQLDKTRDALVWLWNNVLIPFTIWILGTGAPAVLSFMAAFGEGSAIAVQAFRYLLTAVFEVFGKILAGAEKAFGWIKGVGGMVKDAKASFDEFSEDALEGLTAVENGLRRGSDGLRDMSDKSKAAAIALEKLAGKNVAANVTVNFRAKGPGELIDAFTSGGAQVASDFGDTHSARGYRGDPKSTLTKHGQVASALGGGYRITNMFTGGGGHGPGSGDHQRGRAVDVVGRNLPAYASEVRRQGGYAAIHGEGPTKHVHAVMGDTATPRTGRSAGSVGTRVNVEAGAIVIQVHGGDPTDVKRAVKEAWAEITRDAEEQED